MRSILPLILLLTASLLPAAAVDIYFGTGGGEAKGIYRATLDTEKGKLSAATLAAEIKAPGFLAFHPDRTKLYALANPPAGASVVAYQIQEGGELALLNSELIPDGRAAHLSVHPSGKFLLTAQYGGGSVAVFPLAKDGQVERLSTTPTLSEPMKAKESFNSASEIVVHPNGQMRSAFC